MIRREWYKQLIENLLDTKPLFEKRNVGYQDLYQYFYAHFDRLYEAVLIIDRNIDCIGFKIHELGSLVPFISYPLVKKWKCCAEVSSVISVPDFVEDSVYMRYSNLCFDDFGNEKYDLVITTEVFEHLYCDLVDVRNRVACSVKKGGYWFISFPTIGGKEVDFAKRECDKEELYRYKEIHVREFSEEMENEFINIDGFEVVDKVVVSKIHQYLLRRKVA